MDEQTQTEPAPTLKPRVCCKNGCQQPATHLACLRIRAWPGSPCCDGVLDLPLCKAHIAKMKIEDFTTPESRRVIDDTFMAQGKAKPSWRSSEAIAWPIDECPDMFRNRYEPAEAAP